MDKAFQLEILTPRKRLFSGSVTSLVAPGALGYLGVLANHAPLVSTLVAGKVVYRGPSGSATALQSAGTGLLEVNHNKVTLLLDALSQ